MWFRGMYEAKKKKNSIFPFFFFFSLCEPFHGCLKMPEGSGTRSHLRRGTDRRISDTKPTDRTLGPKNCFYAQNGVGP